MALERKCRFYKESRDRAREQHANR